MIPSQKTEFRSIRNVKIPDDLEDPIGLLRIEYAIHTHVVKIYKWEFLKLAGINFSVGGNEFFNGIQKLNLNGA